MTPSFRVGSVLGIPIRINLTWLLTLAFVTTILALRFYPEVFPRGSRYRDDELLHWLMALGSGLVFFASILLHELAHSLVARRQGIPVKDITLFIFGGVSQIGGEARRPLNEFVMAVVGPLTSLLLAGVFFAVWWLLGRASDNPLALVVQWLFIMNLVVAAFNMAPGFPMDGGRVLRSIVWAITGNLFRATRVATLVGRSMGYSLMGIGLLAFFGTIDFIDPWSGVWFGVLGLFLEVSARNSWLQARAVNALGSVRAGDVMSETLPTAFRDEKLRFLVNRGGRRFIFFVSDDDEQVVGVLTEKEAAGIGHDRDLEVTAEQVMLSTTQVLVAAPEEDGASLLQRMDAGAVWHMPVVAEGRVIGVVSRESLLRLLAQTLFRPRRLAGERPR